MGENVEEIGSSERLLSDPGLDGANKVYACQYHHIPVSYLQEL